MRFIYLSLVFLFAREIRTVRGSGTGNTNSGRWANQNLNPQSPSGSSPNPCDRTQARGGNTLAACRTECLALGEEISTLYNEFWRYDSVQYLQKKCGLLIEGECENTASSSPVCSCHTPSSFKDQRIVSLSDCRSGEILVTQFVSAVKTTSGNSMFAKNQQKQKYGYGMGDGSEMEAVNVQQGFISRPDSTRKLHRSTTSKILAPTCCVGLRTDSPDHEQQQEEAAAVGEALTITAVVSGKSVLALLETASSFSFVHKSLMNKPTTTSQTLTNAMNEPLKISGVTNIIVEILGVQIQLEAFVTEMKIGLILGNDFLAANSAKISIPGMRMELNTKKGKVSTPIKFTPAPAWVYVVDGENSEYTPLQISANVNRKDTTIIIDTGSAISFVNRNLIPTHQTLRSDPTKCSFGGNSPIGFMGEGNVLIQFESQRLSIPALVPDQIPEGDFFAGNDFNKKYLNLIDYAAKSVTLKLPDGSISTTAFFTAYA